jgi:hypothetical protein
VKLDNLPGSPLSERDYEMLGHSFISRSLADAAYLRRVTDIQGREVLSSNGRSGNFAGLLIPYTDLVDGSVCTFRLRRDRPDFENRDGKLIERAKYLSAPNARNHLYIAPWTPAALLNDVTAPILLVEGEKKCLAMWNVTLSERDESGAFLRLLPIGLPGVWGWHGRVGKMTAQDGTRRDVRGVIPDFQSLSLNGRTVIILFDTNVRTNPDVAEARRRLAGWLKGCGARVLLAELAPETGINGPDDVAAKHGAAQIRSVLRNAVPFGGDEVPCVFSPEERRIVQEQPYRGFLWEYEEYGHACLPEVPRQYHTLIGLILQAGLLAIKVRTDFGLKPNLAGVIVAFQGAGKSLPGVIARGLTDPIEREEEVSYKEKLAELNQELSDLKRDERKSEGGDGEDSAKELADEIKRMERCGRPAIIIATQASVEGLLEALSNESSGIADFDEFAAFLKDCRREHMRSARENFIKVLDGHPIYYRRARGESVDILDPALSMWGTVNVESLRLAADDEDMFGGFFSRILFCATDYDFQIPYPIPADARKKEKLQSRIRAWRGMNQVKAFFETGVRERSREYSYAIAPFAKGEHIDITEPEDQVAAVGYVRYGTHAQKVALLISAGEVLNENPTDTLTVTRRHMLLAIDLVEQFRQQAVRLLRHLEAGDPLTRDADKLLARIRRCPGQDRSQYHRAMRWSAQRFGNAMNELEKSHRVNWEEQPSTGGRKRRIYFPADLTKHSNRQLLAS